MKLKLDRRLYIAILIVLLICLAVALCWELQAQQQGSGPEPEPTMNFLPVFDPGEENGEEEDEEIPPYSGAAYVSVHGNTPYFAQEEYTTDAFENYSELDGLGRCGVAYANICKELMPTERRESISSVRPSGWQSVRYNGLVDGGSLYNRCHLIGFQLAGENANPKNLITGTRYLNINGMLDFENLVADYVKETDGHVLYRVTPVFTGENLVADGVLMEGWSVEDSGEGVCFCVFAYNVQPGVEINYATGESALTPEGEELVRRDYVLNTAGKTFHLPDCPTAESMRASNRQEFTGTRAELVEQGYTPCGRCLP